jgi:hypothetical protein
VDVPTQSGRPPINSVQLSDQQLVGFDIWRAGQPDAGKPIFHFRETIPIMLFPSSISDLSSQTEVYLVGPDGAEYAAQAQAANLYLFLVGARWPSGQYRLRLQSHDGKPAESQSVLQVEVRPRNFNVPLVSNQVRANFGDEMMLLGFDFPERRAQPGDTLPITLYWQAQRSMDRHYIVSNHLLNNADLRQWGGRDRVPQDYYSTVLWTPGEVVRDEFLVPIAPSAPPGIYRLDIGLYIELAGQSWHLPLMRDGIDLNSNSVTITPIKVGGPPPGVTIDNPVPQYPRQDNLSGFVTLLGYDMDLSRAEELRLTLYWHCDARLPADYTTFVHVRDRSGPDSAQTETIVAQMDSPPANGTYPTSLWEPGEIIRDSVQVPLPSGIPPGEYEVIVGLYDFATGGRLPALDEHGATIDDHIRLEKEVSVQ